MLYERGQVRKIETDYSEIRDAHRTINTAHRHLAVLASLGESVAVWDENDYRKFRERRLGTDSLLQVLQSGDKDFAPAAKIDTLRTLLADKEEHLRNTMRAFRRYDSLLLKSLPSIARQSASSRTVTRRKKGIAGFFGGKEIVQVPNTEKSLKVMNERVASVEKERQRIINDRMDSLCAQNQRLNTRLYLLLRNLDEQSRSVLQERERYMKEAFDRSARTITGLVICAIFLLAFSYRIILRDIRRKMRAKEERERLIEELDQSVKKNGELLASRKKAMHTVTHELRTPLTVIHGYAGLIPKEGDAEKTARYTHSIRQASERMTAMLNSLLEFFRLDSGREQPNAAPFRLQSVADALSADFTPLSEEKDLLLSVECDTDIIVMGDKERIMQVCDNLLANAVKFTQAGSISVSLGHSDSTLKIVVEDTGSGMTEEEQRRVFEAFERLSNAATQDGFGLGLSIVRRIVDMLGGTIQLDSEKGRGSRFTVMIPMQPADAVAEEGKVQKPGVEKSYSVLALDDNEVVLNMMKDMYASVGVHCDTFSNVGDMMEAVRTRRYDLMITDLKMPEMNGYEVLELMRSSSIGNSKEIPVIVATASGSCGEEELLARGFTACLFKPFTLSELLETSGKCLSVNAGKDELPDLASLLAYGDKAAMLDRLITETEKDMQAVREAGESDDRKALDGWVHRLRSSWAVIRADKPLWELYELLHRNEDSSEEELQRAVSAILEKGDMIIKVAKEERRKSDEDICD